MTTQKWDFLAGRASHDVVLEHSLFSGRKRILVDGVPLPIAKEESFRAFDPGSVHPFEVAGLPCEVIIRLTGSQTFAYTLVVDGKVHPSGEAPTYPEHGVGPWWARAIEASPSAFAAVAGGVSLALAGFAVVLGLGYAQRPDAPPSVALAGSGGVSDDAFIELTGLAIDCSAPPLDLDGTLFRAAGRDAVGALVVVASAPDEACRPDAARVA